MKGIERRHRKRRVTTSSLQEPCQAKSSIKSTGCVFLWGSGPGHSGLLPQRVGDFAHMAQEPGLKAFSAVASGGPGHAPGVPWLRYLHDDLASAPASSRHHRFRARLALVEQHPDPRRAVHGADRQRLCHARGADCRAGSRGAGRAAARPAGQHPPAQRPLRWQRGAAGRLAGRADFDSTGPRRTRAPLGPGGAHLRAHRTELPAVSLRGAVAARQRHPARRPSVADPRSPWARHPFGDPVRARRAHPGLGRRAVGARLRRGVPRARGRRRVRRTGRDPGPDRIAGARHS
jgi:hypothetical protein